MAPAKSARAALKRTDNNNITLMPVGRKNIKKTTVQQSDSIENSVKMPGQKAGKRKAELSPIKNDKIKRSALCNLTNNANTNINTTSNANASEISISSCMLENDINHRRVKKAINAGKPSQMKVHRTVAAVTAAESTKTINGMNKIVGDADKAKVANNTEIIVTKMVTRSMANRHNDDNNGITDSSNIVNEPIEDELPTITTTATTTTTTTTLRNREQANCMALQQAPLVPHKPPQQQQRLSNKQVRRISNEFNKTEESLYMSALEDVSVDSLRLSGTFEQIRLLNKRVLNGNKTTTVKATGRNDKMTSEGDMPSVSTTPPEGVEDFDKENLNDPCQVSIYAMDIFNYMKQREESYQIDDYMPRQVHLSKWMRSLLVDWMVEVQETFELNHETLYLAVKIVDIYLSKQIINKDVLQLLGAAALLIACKYDERTPPLIEDFLYICDGAYKHKQLLDMEMQTLRIIEYDLSMPLSYRFLRRYARCARIKMPTLTLARYILELSLMDYDTVRFRDSKMATAALFMALRMHGDDRPWNRTLEYYSGYVLSDFAFIVPVLNYGLHCKAKSATKTIRNKYSHKIFYEVAKVSPMTVDELFRNNLDLNECVYLQTQRPSSRTK